MNTNNNMWRYQIPLVTPLPYYMVAVMRRIVLDSRLLLVQLLA